MPKHTPGPWFIDQNGHVYGWKPTDGGKVSSVLVDNRHTDATFADKTLIADAPALLDALRWALDQLDDSLDPDYRQAFDAATALVARHD